MIDEEKQLKDLRTLASLELPSLTETWQDAIDAAIWSQVLVATGTVTRDITEQPYKKVVLAGTANSDTARILTVASWQLAPDTWGLNTIQKSLTMEWECKFDTVASIDNTVFFMGLGAAVGATRTATNIAGFILTADALNAITDDSVGETVSAVGAPVLTNWMKLKIVAYSACIEFYVNEVMQARHTTAAGEDLPDVNAYGIFYVPQEAAANGGELHVAPVSIRPGVIV